MQRQLSRGPVEFTFVPGELPFRMLLEQSIFDLVCGKAAGPDHLPLELVRFAGGALSGSLYALFLKMTMRLDETLQWKRGNVHRTWKGKQLPEDCDSHRALLVSLVIGKSMHSVIRRCCVGPMRFCCPVLYFILRLPLMRRLLTYLSISACYPLPSINSGVSLLQRMRSRRLDLGSDCGLFSRRSCLTPGFSSRVRPMRREPPWE